MKRSVWWVSAVLWISLVASASAQAKKVVVLEFGGKGAASVRQHVVAVLSDQSDVELVSRNAAENAAAELGGPLRTPANFVAVAEKLGVDAFVEGDVERRKGRWVAKVRVRDASTGEVVGEEPWARKKRPQLKAIRGNFWPILGPAIMASSAPAPVAAPEPVAQRPAPPPTPASSGATTETAEQPEPEATRQPAQRSALTFDILPGLMWRNLSYNDADANLRGYHNDFANPAFLVGFETEWFPGAHFTDSRWADLGIEAGLDYALGLKSNDGGTKVNTTAWDLMAGAVFRIPVDVFTPKLKLGYVRQVFDVDVDPDQVFLPNVEYSALRLGAGFAMEVGDLVELEIGLAYLWVLNAGELYSDRYFPKGTAGGVDLTSSAIFYLKDWVGLMLGIDWRRYGHDFKADPSFMQEGGMKLAGGAVDSYVKLDFGVRFRL